MSTAQHELPASSEELLREVSRLSNPALDTFLDHVLQLRAERRAPHLSREETGLLESINYRRPPEVQARFDQLVTRRRANKITSAELKELRTLTDQSEMQAAERVRAVADLARLRGISVNEMLRQLGI